MRFLLFVPVLPQVVNLKGTLEKGGSQSSATARLFTFLPPLAALPIGLGVATKFLFFR